MKSRKRITMTVTVSVPHWLSAADARREVRTLINEQCNYLDGIYDRHERYHEIHGKTLRAVKVGAA